MWITQEEMRKILDKPYLDVSDIAKLAGCKHTKASLIKTEVRKKTEMSGQRIVNARYVNTSAVVEYLQNDYITQIYYNNICGEER